MAKKKQDPKPAAPALVNLDAELKFDDQGFGALPFVQHENDTTHGKWISTAQVEATLDRIKAAGLEYNVIGLRAYCASYESTDTAAAAVLEGFESEGSVLDWSPHENGLSGDGWTLCAVLREDMEAFEKDAVAIMARAPGTEARAAEFLIGNLMLASKKRFMGLAVPWSQLSEHEQSSVLRGLADDVRQAVGHAIKAIASNQRLTFRAEVESVQFKGASDIKAVLKLMAGTESHALADSAGGFVTVVIENVDELLDLPDSATKGDADQKPLFDQSTGGASVDTKREAVPA